MNRIKDLAERERFALRLMNYINGQSALGLEVTVPLPPTFQDHVTDFIALRDKVLAYGTVKVFRTCRNLLQQFAKKVLKNRTERQFFQYIKLTNDVVAQETVAYWQ